MLTTSGGGTGPPPTASSAHHAHEQSRAESFKKPSLVATAAEIKRRRVLKIAAGAFA